MTKSTMPEPIGEVNIDIYGNTQTDISAWNVNPGHYLLITTDQAESYAAAKVREALECVSREVHNVLHPTNSREDWTQYAYIREEAAHDAESAIRALIPHNDNEQGE